MSLVAAGKAELGIYSEHEIIKEVANQGVGIKSIGAICHSPLSVIMSLKDKNITGPKDLEGKTLGHSANPIVEASIKCMMRNAGVDENSFDMVDVGFDIMSAMTTGNVDATVGGMLNHEVPQLNEQGFEVNYFFPCDYGVPDNYECVLISNNDCIDNDPEMLASFLRASRRGFEDFVNDPMGTLDILMAYQEADNYPLTRSVEEQSCQVLLPVMQPEGVTFLSQEASNWDENIQWLLDEGMISNKIDASQVMTTIQE